jgi:hypothetical protein
MLVFPQLPSGALSHFPVSKRIRFRTVVNRAPDGSSIKAPDPAGETTEWTLSYSGLSDSEAATLEQFFKDAEGRLNGFTFLDPSANLFAASDNLDAKDWEKDPLLGLTTGADDPRGGKLAWRLQNSGGGPQSLAQTLAAPPGYVYCVSAYVLAPQASSVTLFAGSQRLARIASAQWGRVTLTASPDTPRFGVEIPAGAEIVVYGLQVEAQPAASEYQSTTGGGVYEGARLKDDSFQITATGVNRHSCTLNIIHANHL